MPAISVITPVYKVERYLGKCIESILSQTFSDFELFIVDDGSPDRCGSIADTYAEKDPRVHVIHKENGGAPSARNAGIEKASGKYLYFPDSDDWLEADYLEQLYNKAEKTGADLVISGFIMEYYENGKAHSYTVNMPEADYSSKELVRKNLHRYFDNMMMAVPWNKLYRTSYITGHHLRFPNLKWDDLHFNMDVIMDIETVAVCEASGYHFFRSRPGSETTFVFDGMLYRKRKEQFEHILSVYEHWNISDKEILSEIYGYYGGRLVQCVQEISISGMDHKKALIREILQDPLTLKTLKNGKIASRLISIAAIPMKAGSIIGCILMGKTIGFVKTHMSSMFYRIKSRSVNKATG